MVAKPVLPTPAPPSQTMFWLSQRVVEGHDLFLIKLGLLAEGKSLNDPGFRNVGLSEPEFSEALTFNTVFLFDDPKNAFSKEKSVLSCGFCCRPSAEAFEPYQPIFTILDPISPNL